ncbi:MAG TPA: hypothetical protein VEC19_06730 [Usitatibacter sp.]|nr:hypothetical protein [Usitatibacter sp.]
MKAIAIAVGTLLAAAATGAAAQFEDRPYPWNDIRNGSGWGENRWHWRDEPPARYWDNRRYWDARDWRGVAHECWNWRAGTFELAREGEYQDDLDYGRCRPLRYESRRYYYRY